MSIKRTFVAALLVAFTLGANAADPAPSALIEQPVAKAQLAPEALASLNAPLEATVTAKPFIRNSRQ